MQNPVFSPWPLYSEEEATAVHDVLLSNKVNYWAGDKCQQFEKKFAEWVGTKYAVALANGTVALDCALNALGVGDSLEDEVIVTSRTFIASISSIVNTGASPVFVDVDKNTQNIAAEFIEESVTSNTKAILCVHLAGYPCDMDPIMELAEKYGLYVIEDCAQAHGASYKGRSVGSIGHVGAWSFCQDKILTTGGEGGMITTNDHDVWSKVWSYKDHGKSWDAVYKEKHFSGHRWVHESFGTNGRMTEMQAAIGLIQLDKINDWHNVRVSYANKILEECKQHPSVFRVPELPDHIEHAWYKCYVFVRSENLKHNWSRDRIVEEIKLRGVPCYQGSCSEVYLEKAFDNTNFRPKARLPVAKHLGETSIMFLVHPTITTEEIFLTCSVIKEVTELVEGSK